jgi:hypothetical protein
LLQDVFCVADLLRVLAVYLVFGADVFEGHAFTSTPKADMMAAMRCELATDFGSA